MAEWLKAHAWKACGYCKVAREFESLPLRFVFSRRVAMRECFGSGRGYCSEFSLCPHVSNTYRIIFFRCSRSFQPGLAEINELLGNRREGISLSLYGGLVKES